MKPNTRNTTRGSVSERIFQVLILVAVIYAFLISLEMMGASFKLFGKDFAKNLVQTASNPFVGLFIGILATAIVQSSSTTTSTVVVLVASGAFGPASDPSTIAAAVPIIMGANIGTSVTSTIVALGHITDRGEYRNAVAASTVHNFFNIITVTLLFPLEYFFGALSRPATALAEVMYVGGGDGGLLSVFKVINFVTKPVSDLLIKGVSFLVGGTSAVLPLLALAIALLMLFFSLRGLASSLKKYLIGRLKERVDQVVFGNPFKALFWGAGITSFVQSSSVTSSLTVPLVATGKVSMRKAFPFLMGANVGTTATALIAALLTVGANPIAGLAIALCHVFFNLAGVLFIFPVPQVRNLPVRMAEKLGDATMRNRLYGVGYIAVTFFLVPFLLILLTGSSPSSRLDDKNISADEAKPLLELVDEAARTGR